MYRVECSPCGWESPVEGADDVAGVACEHLRVTHPNLLFPQPALSLIRVHEFHTLEFPDSATPRANTVIPCQLLPPAGRLTAEEQALTKAQLKFLPASGAGHEEA
jgi:hypothetical protein